MDKRRENAFKSDSGQQRRQLFLSHSEFRSYGALNQLNPDFNSPQGNLRIDYSLESSLDPKTKLFLQKLELVNDSTLTNPDKFEFIENNTNVFVRRSDPEAMVFFIHGYGGTSMIKNQIFLKSLCCSNLAIFAMDGRGFGLSDGLHGFISDFDSFVCDYETIFLRCASLFPEKKKFIVSSSMGGAVSIFLSKRSCASLITGFVLLCPLLRISDDLLPSYPIIQLFKLASWFLPFSKSSPSQEISYKIYKNAQLGSISRENPIYYTEVARLKTSYELIKATSEITEIIEDFDKPFLLLHGQDDTVTCPKASRDFFDCSKSQDKEIFVLPDQRHALLWEDQGAFVYDKIVSWIISRAH